MTPLAVWASNISDPHKHHYLVKTEQCMTHSNFLPQLASFFYSYAIHILIKNKDDANRAEIAYNTVLALSQTESFN
jgi:hypothetical protein